MSIAANPKATFDYVLESDRGNENPPVFVLRYLPADEWQLLQRQSDMTEGIDEGHQVVHAAKKIITAGLVDWRNVILANGSPADYDASIIGKVASLEDIMELMYAVVNQRPSPEDKKKLSSQSPSSTANAE